MAINLSIPDLPEYITRGERIQSVLNGSGTVDVLPGRPDVAADSSDWEKRERYNPDIDFDPNAFSRIDKFDGLELGQDLIDSTLDNGTPAMKQVMDSSGVTESKEK